MANLLNIYKLEEGIFFLNYNYNYTGSAVFPGVLLEEGGDKEEEAISSEHVEDSLR